MKYILGLLFCFQSVFALDQEDRDVMERVVQDYVLAWNDFGCNGFADNFSDDCDFINIFGMHFRGREAVEKRHVEILDTFLKGTKFRINDITIREANKGVAIVLVDWTVGKPGGKKPLQGIFSHVFVEVDGVWQITASQNTLKKDRC